MIHDRTWGSRVFTVINYVLISLLALATITPFIHLIAASLTTAEEVREKSFILFPTVLSWNSYSYILSTNTIILSMGNTVFITVFGTLVNIAMTTLMAYPLAHKTLIGRSRIMMLVLFTMMFGGGMIPSFILVKQLGMLNTYWSVIIPGAISAFNLIVIKNFFQQLPEGLEESAKMDGANDLYILARIVIPLSMPAIATFSLFYAVGHWNAFLGPILYLNDPDRWPIQVLMRQIIILSQGGIGNAEEMGSEFILPPEQTLKSAVIVFANLPILLVYPFLQKHFAKGVLLGSVKG
ncbi:putative aldouronate transport system permease protein [Paenibacillus sp. 1_12]|uniref:carbohydrate ABC transporter permease n=1 Tax=Paenibacillus sp. 1_12 TaxID=1566278 RepID=UPI0008E34F68|nr:carbohydrate ABC transporter permease [Paenibacillus sp. 1_12]SFM15880.1 putative aldouronate transport system permease protein [Paenibacillus sp. 1_12]